MLEKKAILWVRRDFRFYTVPKRMTCYWTENSWSFFFCFFLLYLALSFAWWTMQIKETLRTLFAPEQCLEGSTMCKYYHGRDGPMHGCPSCLLWMPLLPGTCSRYPGSLCTRLCPFYFTSQSYPPEVPKRQSGTLIAGLPPPRLKVSLWFIRSLMTSFVKWSMRLTWPNSKNPSGHSNVSEVDPGNQLLFGTVIWESFSFWRDLIYIWLNIWSES